MPVENGDIIKIFYTEKYKKGQVFFSNFGMNPIEFEVGTGSFNQEVEQKIIGMKKGEKKEIQVQPKKAYGYRSEDNVQTFARGYYEENIKKGDEYGYFDSNLGEKITGIVTEVKPKTIVVDFNHKLCGQTIKYEVEICDIKK